MKRNIGPILGIVFIVIVSLVVGVQYTSAHKELVEAQAAAISANTGGNGSSGVSTADSSLRTKMKEVTGYDYSRVKSDDMTAESLFKSIFTWDTYDEYMENRQQLLDMGVDADSYVMTTFFPELKQVTPDNGDEPYYVVNDGTESLNMAYGSMTSRVTGIDGNVYSYFAEVTITTETSYEKTDGNTQKTVGTAVCVLLYDVDGDGNMTNLDAYTIQ